MSQTRARLAAAALLSGALAATPALADKLAHPTAVFAGLDKITGRIISFDVAKDETVQFGSLQITPKVCYTRPPTEAPQTTTFVEVDDVGFGDKSELKRLFSGWMYAASPGLHGIEHPVYDVWLTNCKGEGQLIKTQEEVVEAPREDPTLRLPRSAGSAAPRRGPDALDPGAGGDAMALRPSQPLAPLPPLMPPPQAQAEQRRPARSFFPTNQPVARPEIGSTMSGGQ